MTYTALFWLSIGLLIGSVIGWIETKAEFNRRQRGEV